MKRPIIKIDESLCDGCGNCVVGCSEGALQIIDGKAKLVNEQFCDGFGDCIGTCPTGALKIEETESQPFDLNKTREHLLKTQGVEAVWRMEEAFKTHTEKAPISSGCPGAAVLNVPSMNNNIPDIPEPEALPSALTQWPIQLHLVPVKAPFFRDKELVFMSTCAPLTYNGVHSRYLKGRSVIVACPKLDDTRNYIPKLGEILKQNRITKVVVVRIEVPCCGGLTVITQKARQISGKQNLNMEEHVIGIRGQIMEIKEI